MASVIFLIVQTPAAHHIFLSEIQVVSVMVQMCDGANGCNFTDKLFSSIFIKEKLSILIGVSLFLSVQLPINSIDWSKGLVPSGTKPLPQAMMSN